MKKKKHLVTTWCEMSASELLRTTNDRLVLNRHIPFKQRSSGINR